MTIAYLPAAPIPAEETTLSATSTLVHADDVVVHWYLSSAPTDSALETGFLLDDAGAHVSAFTPDVAGAYSFSGYVYCQLHDHGQQKGETRLVFKEEQTATVYVCDLLNLPVVTTLGHGATIQIGVCNATVRSAEFVNPTTEVGRLATLDATALASLSTMVDVAVTAIDDTLQAAVTDLYDNFLKHRTNSTHSASDTVNVITRRTPYSNASAIADLNDFQDKMLAHMMPGTTGVNTHNTADDTKNLPLVAKATDAAEAVVLSSDLRFRVYSRHISQHASPASHTGSGDTSNTLIAAKPLAAAIRDYLDALSVLTSAPAGEQQGALDAALRFGFKRAA